MYSHYLSCNDTVLNSTKHIYTLTENSVAPPEIISLHYYKPHNNTPILF